MALTDDQAGHNPTIGPYVMPPWAEAAAAVFNVGRCSMR